MTAVLDLKWVEVCRYDDLLPERGVAALVGGHQVAVFRTHNGDVFAVGNTDPFSGANVLSRGLVGTRGDVPVVMSPMYKQAIALTTGRSVDNPAVAVPVWPVRIVGDVIQVGQ